jgi:hypothetical protein
MIIKLPENPPEKDLTRFNGFELLAWDFNPRWAMRSPVITQIEFANRIMNCGLVGPSLQDSHWSVGG